MPGLGETVFDLAQSRRSMQGETTELAGLGRLTRVPPMGSNPGELTMLVYVPPGLPPGAPLVVVLHGCTQTAPGYDHGAGWSTLAERHGFALLFPEQDRANNANLCFNWFEPGDVTRGDGEVLSIKQMIDQMVSTYGLNPARVYINGLSAGGAMTAAMLATYPELFAAGAIVAGLPYGAASGVQQAFEAMHHVRPRSAREWGDLVRAASPYRGQRPPVQIWHGGADATVRPGSFDELIKQWANVNGVLEAPFADRIDGAIHQVWRGSASNDIVLESYFIPGLGHGTPLDTVADELDQSVGFPAPHMLEAGISSTWRMARSWGLLTQPAQPRRQPQPGPARETAQATGVAGVIEGVLRAAGLKG
jgi:poly(hydroxyalkanoate) depolymerase family esterase